jgi:hypothetical protein
VGYSVATNLWVSAGYNFFGYRDTDLAGADYTAKGPFVRLRYKFDENIFGTEPVVPAKAGTQPVTQELSPSGSAPASAGVTTPYTGSFVPVMPSGGGGTQPSRDGSGPL